ncbi:hypothetical protein NQZ79_g3400 [Umbelopsis isabellina]|nr:hypothetical protein NQZ79_g3400 [Umbelopsis isabellina]
MKIAVEFLYISASRQLKITLQITSTDSVSHTFVQNSLSKRLSLPRTDAIFSAVIAWKTGARLERMSNMANAETVIIDQIRRKKITSRCKRRQNVLCAYGSTGDLTELYVKAIVIPIMINAIPNQASGPPTRSPSSFPMSSVNMNVTELVIGTAKDNSENQLVNIDTQSGIVS